MKYTSTVEVIGVRMQATRHALVLFALFAGCATPAALDVTPGSSLAAMEKPVVVAVLDTGTNPYLSAFRTADRAALAFIPPVTEIALDLDGPGTIQERAKAEADLWKSLEFRQLYHFTDTRILAISFETFDGPIGRGAHGAATSYLTAREAPTAWIVAVQVNPVSCREDTSCAGDPSMADGMEWIADQDWIDVVSISISVPAHMPDVGALHAEYARYLAASERAALDGKLIVNAAGNEPTSCIPDYFCGPPWITTVGGFEPESRGATLMSGKSFDVVANMTEKVPKPLSDELEDSSGTSFATPIVAGTLAHALHLVRQADPSRIVTPQEARDALNATAVYFEDPTQWDPVPSCRGDLAFGCIYTATAPVIAQPQMGWGYIDASMAPEIARRILEADLDPPADKQQAVVFQGAWQRAREEYWSTQP